MELFVKMAISQPFYYFSWVFIVVFSICVHEYAHAATALQLGDDTAARSGHLSLNPLVQMGRNSLIALLLLGIAWGAVPINPYALSSRQRAAVSFAGPLANLMLCAAFAVLAWVAMRLPSAVESRAYIFWFFQLGSTANAMLFLFNMLPIPLLDGWSVLAGYFPRMNNIDATTAANVSFLIMGVFFMSPVGGILWLGASQLSGLFVGTMLRLGGIG
ncbi:MAG TPA: site-2 protease family protein [Kiritimatiellia bacterium]|jgi:Zn-dependent protease